MSGWRRNRIAVEAWKATRPEYAARAKRKLLALTLRRLVARQWRVELRRTHVLTWSAILARMESVQWAVPSVEAT